MTRPARRFVQWIDRVSDALGGLIRWLALAMVVIGAFNALARYGGRSLGWQLSSNAYIELQWYLFSAVFLLGGAPALRADRHVRVDVLRQRLSARWRRRLDLAGHLLFLLPFCGLMLWVSVPAALRSWRIGEVSPDPGGLVRYPLRMLVPLAFLFLALQGVADIVRWLGPASAAGEEWD